MYIGQKFFTNDKTFMGIWAFGPRTNGREQ